MEKNRARTEKKNVPGLKSRLINSQRGEKSRRGFYDGGYSWKVPEVVKPAQPQGCFYTKLVRNQLRGKNMIDKANDKDTYDT